MFDLAALIGFLVLVSLSAVAYAYLVYPFVIFALSRLFGRREQRPEVTDAELPTVTLIIAAYNEAIHVRKRLENALELSYPADKLEIILASDGSKDATGAIAREFTSRGVRVLDFPQNRGKASVLNDAVQLATGEVVMFSDANTFTNPDALRLLAAWFRDPNMGSVCGRLILIDPTAGKNVDGLYWKYETLLKKCESRLGALLGSNGAIYAIRRKFYQPIAANTLVDDFVIPLLARKTTGCRLIYDTDAIAHEETPARLMSEFHRRARIGAGGFQSIVMLKSLLNPIHGWVAFTFLSHKVLRWVSPFFLLIGFFGSLAMSFFASKIFLALLVIQILFYLCALGSARLPSKPRVLKIFRLPALFTLINAALLVGFFRWLRKPSSGVWVRTERTEVAPTPVSVFTRSNTAQQMPSGAT